jgi:hypothetical protein
MPWDGVVDAVVKQRVLTLSLLRAQAIDNAEQFACI